MRFFPRPTSLTSRLTLWFALSAIGLVTLCTCYLYWSLVRELDYRDGQLIDSKLEAIRTLLAEQPGDYTSLKTRVEKEWPSRISERVYVRIIDSSGKLITETPKVPDEFRRAEAMFARLVKEGVIERSPRLLHFEDQVFRAVRASIRSPWNAKGTFIAEIALDRSQESSILVEYRRRLIVVVLLSTLFCVFVSYEITRRGILPLRRMQSTAGRISSSNLNERMRPEAMPAELARLAETFNGMLDRLKDSFDRLQRFSADIAHELRTPINNLTGELSLTIGKHRTPEEYEAAIGSALEECDRVSRIIDSLLFLARSENPQLQIRKEKVDIRRELENVVEFYSPLAAERDVELRVTTVEAIEILVERTLFQRAIGNLLSNAIRHTPPKGTITVSAVKSSESAIVTVADTGEGIAPEHVSRLFDRFYRVDESRTKNSGGTGLGLAIVQSIAAIHGGRVLLDSRVGSGTRVSIEFPLKV